MLRIKLTIILTLIFANLFCQQKQLESMLVIDTHNDVLSRQIRNGADLAADQPTLDFDLNKATRGNLGAQVFSIWCDEMYGKGAAFAIATREIDSLMALVNRNKKTMVFVTNSKELKRSLRQKRLAAMIGVEGGHMIEDRMDYLDSLVKRGMLYLTLTWNNSVSWATSARDEVTKKDSIAHLGLNEQGRRIVSKLNEKGVMIDLSHAGEKTFDDVLAITTKPVIASHSCAWALNPHRRNLKDHQLKAIAKNGGVVFINFYSEFVDSTYSSRRDSFILHHKLAFDSIMSSGVDDVSALLQLFAQYPLERDAMRPSMQLLINHFDHIIKLVGIDHVGIGADYDGAELFPLQLDDVSRYPLLLAELHKAGYSRKDIRKIANGNFIRVLKANEKI